MSRYHTFLWRESIDEDPAQKRPMMRKNFSNYDVIMKPSIATVARLTKAKDIVWMMQNFQLHVARMSENHTFS